MNSIPVEIRNYLDALVDRVTTTIGPDLLGMWLVGGAAQDAYEHGVSDVDVIAVSGSRAEVSVRQALGEAVVHPALPCPAVGLEFVWYAAPDLVDLADPVRFQLNVNGGPQRAIDIQLRPDESPNWWSVLDLAAAREVGLPLVGTATAAAVIPPVPEDRLRRAVRESTQWHDDVDAGSPNRVLNLARLIVLLDEGRWLSKQGGGAALRLQQPGLTPAIDEALAARAEGRWMDPQLAAPLSDLLRDRLG
ncbi:aminoglycoside adenylyltransferase domain-containing protein [Actinomycetota bacterium]